MTASTINIKTFNELARKTGLTVQNNKDVTFINENGLTVFDFGHKIGVSYMPSEDAECISKTSDLTDDLLSMIYDAIMTNRADMRAQEEQDRIDQLKMTFEEQQ